MIVFHVACPFLFPVLLIFILKWSCTVYFAITKVTDNAVMPLAMPFNGIHTSIRRMNHDSMVKTLTVWFKILYK